MPAPDLIEKLVTANHVLYAQGVLDAFGHVSARDPDGSDHFYISRSLAPQMVTAGDIMRLDFAGGQPATDARKPYLERFIHGAIYKSRPDVMAIVHCHSPILTAFSVSETGLGAVCHMCGFLGTAVPVFEIRHAAGHDSDLLIRTPELGTSLAADLADNGIILMRGHGATIVGDSIEEAVFRAIYAEKNAHIQLTAHSLGKVKPLTAGECVATADTTAGQTNRAWHLWVSTLEGQSG